MATPSLLAGRRVRQPRRHLGQVIGFADGTRARIYRETVLEAATAAPTALAVASRLRWVRGQGHRVFELESQLNTPLFVGFPGFRSKLWLAHDETGRYRGLYEWDGPDAAEHYARSVGRVLALVSEPRSSDYRVLPGLRRDDLLARSDRLALADPRAWWHAAA